MAKRSKPKPKAKPHGRPTSYSEDIAVEICDRLAKGESLKSICVDKHLPSDRTVRTWASDPKHPFSPQYTKAREVGYLRMADELLDISDDGTNDWMERRGKEGEGLAYAINGEAIARSRLRVDTRKWLLSKMLPKVFGDKVVNELQGPNGGPIQIEEINKIDLARRLLHLVATAAAEKKE